MLSHLIHTDTHQRCLMLVLNRMRYEFHLPLSSFIEESWKYICCRNQKLECVTDVLRPNAYTDSECMQ